MKANSGTNPNASRFAEPRYSPTDAMHSIDAGPRMTAPTPKAIRSARSACARRNRIRPEVARPHRTAGQPPGPGTCRPKASLPGRPAPARPMCNRRSGTASAACPSRDRTAPPPISSRTDGSRPTAWPAAPGSWIGRSAGIGDSLGSPWGTPFFGEGTARAESPGNERNRSPLPPPGVSADDSNLTNPTRCILPTSGINFGNRKAHASCNSLFRNESPLFVVKLVGHVSNRPQVHRLRRNRTQTPTSANSLRSVSISARASKPIR